jgi:hypothetical protein
MYRPLRCSKFSIAVCRYPLNIRYLLLLNFNIIQSAYCLKNKSVIRPDFFLGNRVCGRTAALERGRPTYEYCKFSDRPLFLVSFHLTARLQASQEDQSVRQTGSAVGCSGNYSTFKAAHIWLAAPTATVTASWQCQVRIGQSLRNTEVGGRGRSPFRGSWAGVAVPASPLSQHSTVQCELGGREGTLLATPAHSNLKFRISMC